MSILKDLLIDDYTLVFKDSVLVLDGVPYMIMSFKGTKAEVLNIGSQEFSYIDLSKVKSIELPNTGMVNYRGCVSFLQRIPCRKFKHGLSKENTQVVYPEDAPQDQVHHDRRSDLVNTVKALQNKALYNTYTNTYPSLGLAIERLQDGEFEIAFDRQFAVNCEQRLIYKGTLVGEVFDANKVVFKKAYEHLRPALPKGIV